MEIHVLLYKGTYSLSEGTYYGPFKVDICLLKGAHEQKLVKHLVNIFQ